MRPGWPPPESLPARGVASPERDALAELAVFAERAVREALLVAQLHPHRLSTPSCMAQSTFWPRPLCVR